MGRGGGADLKLLLYSEGMSPCWKSSVKLKGVGRFVCQVLDWGLGAPGAAALPTGGGLTKLLGTGVFQLRLVSTGLPAQMKHGPLLPSKSLGANPESEGNDESAKKEASTSSADGKVSLLGGV